MGKTKLKSDSQPTVPWWKRPWLIGAILIALTVLAYLPALRAGFIWDDDDYVTDNITLRSVDGLRRIWFDVGANYQYYPLVHTSFWLEYHAWQLKPAGFHLVNVLLHGLSVVLLWRVLQRLKLPGAWLAAAIWALHPVCVESVAWITERKNVLSAVFYFAAALAWLRWRENRERRNQKAEMAGRGKTTFNIQRSTFNSQGWYVLALGLFVCALLSKTVACSLPAALLLVLWWKNGRLRFYDAFPLVPFFGIGIGMGLFTAWVEKHHVGAVGADWALTFWERCLIAGHALWFYAGKLIWPANLTFIYPRWEISTAVWWQWLFPISAVAVVIALWLLRNRIGRGPLVAVLFFAGTLVPALGFVNVYPMRYSFVADHFQYFACVGLIALAVATVARISKFQTSNPRVAPRAKQPAQPGLEIGRWNFSGAWILVLGASVVVVLGALTWRQTLIYHDLETLWRDTLAKNPACWMAHNNLGEVLRAQGKLDAADESYNAALRFKPAYSEALNNLGYSLFQRDRFEEAAGYYRRAIEADPRFAPAWSNLGAAALSQGHADEAVAHLRHALELDPNSADAMSNLAVALAGKKQFTEAIALCETVLHLHPSRADTWINLGNIYMGMGRANDAIATFAEAARLDPLNSKARTDLAGALAARGDNAGAIRQYSEAQQLTPNDATLRYNLGVLLAATGRTPEAMEQFEMAIKFKPDYAEAHNNLGVALTLAGSVNDAEKHFRSAIKSSPEYAEAHNNLGYALAKLGRREEAIVELREALRIKPDYGQARDQLRALGESESPQP